MQSGETREKKGELTSGSRPEEKRPLAAGEALGLPLPPSPLPAGVYAFLPKSRRSGAFDSFCGLREDQDKDDCAESIGEERPMRGKRRGSLLKRTRSSATHL